MEDRETARMRKYGESKTTRIMMATVPHVTSGLGLENFRPMDFCWHECTNTARATEHNDDNTENLQQMQLTK